jgi:hypothetical protein
MLFTIQSLALKEKHTRRLTVIMYYGLLERVPCSAVDRHQTTRYHITEYRNLNIYAVRTLHLTAWGCFQSRMLKWI